MKKRNFAVLWLLATTFVGCTSPHNDRDDAVDRPLVVTLTRRFAIGGAADTAFTPALLFPHDVAAGNAGQLFALDRSRNQVLEYDAHGAKVHAWFRRGHGPGEVENPLNIATTADGGIAVIDYSKRAIVSLAASGVPKPEFTTRSLGIVQQMLAINDQERSLVVTFRDTNMVLHIDHDVPTRLALVPPAAAREVPAFNTCGLVGQERSPLLTSTLLATGNDQAIAVNDHGAFGLTIHEAGQPTRQLDRHRAQEAFAPGLVKALLGDSEMIVVGKQPCFVPTSLIAQQAGLAPTVPAYRSLVMDRALRVWAMRTVAKGAPQLADIYSVRDGYLGTASLGKVTPVAFLSDGALVAIAKDEDDAPIVVVYDVVAPALTQSSTRPGVQ